jgi:hypothetical protein
LAKFDPAKIIGKFGPEEFDLRSLGVPLQTVFRRPAPKLFAGRAERQAEVVAQLFLTHGGHQSAHPHPVPDVFVDRIGAFGSNRDLRMPLLSHVAIRT